VRTLAVYRLRGWYFVAPAGLSAADADSERRSAYYREQITALSAMIEMQHNVNEEIGR